MLSEGQARRMEARAWPQPSPRGFMLKSSSSKFCGDMGSPEDRSGTDARWVVPGLPELLRLTSCTAGARGFLNSDKETGKENLARTDGRS